MAHSSLNANLFALFAVNYRKSVTVRKIFKSSICSWLLVSQVQANCDSGIFPRSFASLSVLSLRLRDVKQKQYSLCLTAKSIKWNMNERYISNFADTRNAYHIQFVSQFLSYLLGVLLTLASAYIYYHVRFVSDMYHILIVSE